MYIKLCILFAVITINSGCTGKTGQELYSEGVTLLNDGNPGGAIVLFRNALDKEQNHFDARYQLARAYAAAGKYEQAEKEFQKVKRLNPAQPDLQLELAKLYNNLRKPDLAISQAGEYLASQPDSSEALELTGIAYGLKNMPQVAETFFLRALQKKPGNVSAKLELAALQVIQGNMEPARILLEGVIKDNPGNSKAHYILADIEIALGRKDKAFVIYKKLSEINSADPVALYKLGLMGMETGKTVIAETTAAELIKKFPQNGEGYRLKGIVAYQKKELLEAITALQNANKLQPTIAGQYFLGLSLYSKGEWENALSQLRQILDRTPSFHQARLLTGIILLRQNRTDDAISELTKLTESDSKNSLAHSMLGNAYIAKGMYDEGMKELDTATKLDPRLVDVYLKKGMIHLSQGKKSEVETDLTTAIKVAPDVLNVRFSLASFYLHQNNSAKAFATLKEGLSGNKDDAMLYSGMAKIMFANKKPAEALHYLQKSKESGPGFVEPYFALAAYHAGNGDIDKAMKEYSAVLQKEPGNVKAMLRVAMLLESSDREKEALDWYLKAKQTRDPLAYMSLAGYYEKMGNNEKAFSVLDEATTYAPRSVAVMEQKGALYLKLKQYKKALKIGDDIESIEPERGLPLKVSAYVLMKNYPEAIQQAQRAITLKPDFVQGYSLLASVYLEQNNPQRAIMEMKRAFARDSHNPRTALALAGIYAKTGNHSLALSTCEEIVRKHPDFAPAYFAQGTFLEAQDSKKEAVKKYRAALAISNNYAAALNNLAFLCADGYGTKEEALRMAESAAALEPGNPGIIDTLGYALLKNGRYQEARKKLEKAEKLLPGDPVINYHLALVHRASGEKSQAVARLHKALRSEKFPDVNQAKSLLAELN